MPLKFEKVDDILTEKAIESMDRNFCRYRDQIKDTAMDLTHIAQDYDLSENVRMFDDITAIGFALDAMHDILREYQTSYTTLVEKYSSVIRAE